MGGGAALLRLRSRCHRKEARESVWFKFRISSPSRLKHLLETVQTMQGTMSQSNVKDNNVTPCMIASVCLFRLVDGKKNTASFFFLRGIKIWLSHINTFILNQYR